MALLFATWVTATPKSMWLVSFTIFTYLFRYFGTMTHWFISGTTSLFFAWKSKFEPWRCVCITITPNYLLIPLWNEGLTSIGRYVTSENIPRTIDHVIVKLIKRPVCRKRLARNLTRKSSCAAMVVSCLQPTLHELPQL